MKMTFEYDTRRRDMNGGMKSNNASVAPTAPSVFQPPLPPLRNGNHSQHDQSLSHYQNSSIRSDSHYKSPPSSFHQSLSGNIKSESMTHEGRYRISHSSRHMRTLSSDTPGTQSYQKKAPFLSSGKGSFNPYHRQDDTRHPPEASRVVERGGGGDGCNRRGENSAADGGRYHYSRDGPSPGRGYTRPDEYNQQSDQSYSPTQHSGQPNMYINRHDKKRKPHEPITPDGPRLISNQSSDDSINGFLLKKARTGTSLSAESASLMKSFTPLSPMHSRTFSRDEAIDISRFTRRGSNDGYRIFNSWSSGNSNSGSHSPSDVKICYDDWQSGDRNGRAPSGSRSWEEKAPNRDDVSNKGRDNGPSIHYQTSSKSQSSYPKPSPGTGRTQQRWPSPHPQERHQNPRSTTYDNAMHEKNLLPESSAREQCQVLHTEDRCGPYPNHLSHHINSAAQYGQRMDVGRTFWRGQPIHPHLQYASQRRDDMGDRSKISHVPGHPVSPPSRLSAPTPPVTNGYGRFSNDFHHPHLFEMHMSRGARSSYEHWMSTRNRPFGAAPYSNGSSQSHESRESGDGLKRPYSSRCSHLLSVKVETGPNGSSGMRTADGVLLLSLPEDRISLSETLCIVRENVEVFIATEADVKAPAPGRKRPVVEGQVGLRCIHCRSALHQSDKVKRAVCFPSSIKRIYRTVIDMKLDHFKACRFVPIELKMKLEELKATNARSTGTTMQYFVQAAKRMGMLDGTHGIRFGDKDKEGKVVSKSRVGESSNSKNKLSSSNHLSSKEKQSGIVNNSIVAKATASKLDGVPSAVQSVGSFTLSVDLSTSGDSTGSAKKNSSGVKKTVKYHTGKTILALPEDKTALSPLRCFLRENVYAFSATAEDIAVRTPTTFSVVLGQVGIGCIHCHSMPAKERTNRAVCFPFSIGRIYQSVADIQRFHIGECKMVPEAVRTRFLDLQSASSKGSKGLATRQYWVTSAKKLGLVDSDSGIRFGRDPSIPLEKAVSLDILAQVASDVTTAGKPLVLPEDKPHIAGFLYVVMKQLQPCRFTEADRNKRRLKDVGCIGVECKHCAGQVDGRKFFWSSVSAVESNFVSVHTHMMECKMIPKEMKTKLAHLKTLRKEQTARLKSGSQKAFFSRVWKRLHAEGDKVPSVNGKPTAKVVTCQIIKSEPTTSIKNSQKPSAIDETPPVTVAVPMPSKEKELLSSASPTEAIPTTASLNLDEYSSNSSLSSSPTTFPYNCEKDVATSEQSNTEQQDMPKVELLTCESPVESKLIDSIESKKAKSTDDIIMDSNDINSSTSNMLMPLSLTAKDEIIGPGNSKTPMTNESSLWNKTEDVNMLQGEEKSVASSFPSTKEDRRDNIDTLCNGASAQEVVFNDKEKSTTFIAVQPIVNNEPTTEDVDMNRNEKTNSLTTVPKIVHESKGITVSLTQRTDVTDVDIQASNKNDGTFEKSQRKNHGVGDLISSSVDETTVKIKDNSYAVLQSLDCDEVGISVSVSQSLAMDEGGGSGVNVKSSQPMDTDDQKVKNNVVQALSNVDKGGVKSKKSSSAISSVEEGGIKSTKSSSEGESGGSPTFSPA